MPVVDELSSRLFQVLYSQVFQVLYLGEGKRKKKNGGGCGEVLRGEERIQ